MLIAIVFLFEIFSHRITGIQLHNTIQLSLSHLGLSLGITGHLTFSMLFHFIFHLTVIYEYQEYVNFKNVEYS